MDNEMKRHSWHLWGFNTCPEQVWIPYIDSINATASGDFNIKKEEEIEGISIGSLSLKSPATYKEIPEDINFESCSEPSEYGLALYHSDNIRKISCIIQNGDLQYDTKIINLSDQNLEEQSLSILWEYPEEMLTIKELFSEACPLLNSYDGEIYKLDMRYQNWTQQNDILKELAYKEMIEEKYGLWLFPDIVKGKVLQFYFEKEDITLHFHHQGFSNLIVNTIKHRLEFTTPITLEDLDQIKLTLPVNHYINFPFMIKVDKGNNLGVFHDYNFESELKKQPLFC